MTSFLVSVVGLSDSSDRQPNLQSAELDCDQFEVFACLPAIMSPPSVIADDIECTRCFVNMISLEFPKKQLP